MDTTSSTAYDIDTTPLHPNTYSHNDVLTTENYNTKYDITSLNTHFYNNLLTENYNNIDTRITYNLYRVESSHQINNYIYTNYLEATHRKSCLLEKVID